MLSKSPRKSAELSVTLAVGVTVFIVGVVLEVTSVVVVMAVEVVIVLEVVVLEVAPKVGKVTLGALSFAGCTHPQLGNGKYVDAVNPWM